MSLRDFLTTMFSYAKPTYSIANIDDIKRILYLDDDKGTVYQGSQAVHYGFSKLPPYTDIYDWMANRIYTYLNNTSMETISSFDEWHNRLCLDFLLECNQRDISVEYGLAQKFVNLALKYCYCFNDAHIAEKYNKFKFCHIALDGYTFCPSTSSRIWASYRDYYKMSRANLQLPFYTEVVNPAINIKNLPAWSKLTDTQYIDIQNEMRAYFDSHPITYADVRALDVRRVAGCSAGTVLTPFQSEFFLWG